MRSTGVCGGACHGRLNAQKTNRDQTGSRIQRWGRLTCCCNKAQVMGDSGMVDKRISNHDDRLYTDQRMLHKDSGWLIRFGLNCSW